MAKAQETKTDLAEPLRDHLKHWRNVQKVAYRNERLQTRVLPALMQMLTAESTAVRRVLVENLAETEHPTASEALAHVALFDLTPEVRSEAIRALAARPAREYRHVLLAGFRYPWPAVADHAADALVTLNDYRAVPDLKNILNEPDPRAPFSDQGTMKVRELVRINHLRNCLLCHAPSRSENEPIRAQVPKPGRPLPPIDQYYPPSGEGILVRADVTYLKQDFALAQPVAGAAPWPDMQRFDFVVRVRPATEKELAADAEKPADASHPQHDAVSWALKELNPQAVP
jgi:hypothetical protein